MMISPCSNRTFTRIHNSRGYPTSVWVKVVAHWRFQPSSMIIGIIRIKLSELYFALAYIFTCSDWSKMSCLLNYLCFKMAHGIPLTLDNWKSGLGTQKVRILSPYHNILKIQINILRHWMEHHRYELGGFYIRVWQ